MLGWWATDAWLSAFGTLHGWLSAAEEYAALDDGECNILAWFPEYFKPLLESLSAYSVVQLLRWCGGPGWHGLELHSGHGGMHL